MRKRYTSQDIADRLGISRGTVYRALNDKGRISEETRKKVLKVAEELGYKPNRLAQSLVMRKETTIAAILPTVPEYFFGKIEEGVKNAEERLRDYGVSVKYYHTNAVNDEYAQIEIFENIINKNFGGILVIPANPVLLGPQIDLAISKGIPVVTLNNDAPDSGRLCFVGEDSVRAGRVAAGLMVEFIGGEGSVAILSGFSTATGMSGRIEGFTSVIKSNPKINLLDICEYSENEAEAYQIAKRLIKEQKDLKGIFLTTTTGLEPVAQATIDSGMAGKIKLIGFDTNEQIERLMRENVIHATIHQDPYAQGYYSLRILAQHILNNGSHEKDQEEYMYTRLDILLKEKPKMGVYPLYTY